MSGGPSGLTLLLVVCVLGVAWDLRHRRVPNWLTLPAIPAGWLLAGLAGGWPGVAAALLGAVLGMAILLGPWWRGWVGGGDLKLLMAIGATGGPLLVVAGFAAGSLVAGGLAVAALLRARQTVVAGAGEPVRRLPYAAALAAGTLAVALALRLPGVPPVT